MNLPEEELKSVKNSYFNLLSLFLSEDTVESKYVACLIKWAAQMGLDEKDLQVIDDNFDKNQFNPPQGNLERLEVLYDLVHMIYLDDVVEDIELELAGIYATKLGFRSYLVGELFKSIATAPFDGLTTTDMRKEVLQVLIITA